MTRDQLAEAVQWLAFLLLAVAVVLVLGLEGVR
jgi:hypothetical protein